MGFCTRYFFLIRELLLYNADFATHGVVSPGLLEAARAGLRHRMLDSGQSFFFSLCWDSMCWVTSLGVWKS